MQLTKTEYCLNSSPTDTETNASCENFIARAKHTAFGLSLHHVLLKE